MKEPSKEGSFLFNRLTDQNHYFFYEVSKECSHSKNINKIRSYKLSTRKTQYIVINTLPFSGLDFCRELLNFPLKCTLYNLDNEK